MAGDSEAGALRSHLGVIWDDQPDRAPWHPEPCAPPGAVGEDAPVSPQASLSAAGSRHAAMEGEEEQPPQEVRDRAARGSEDCGVLVDTPLRVPSQGHWRMCGFPAGSLGPPGMSGVGCPEGGHPQNDRPSEASGPGERVAHGVRSSGATTQIRAGLSGQGVPRVWAPQLRHSPSLAGPRGTPCDVRSFGGGAQGAFRRTPEPVSVLPETAQRWAGGVGSSLASGA